jgi:hypothetical protein
MSDFSKLVRDKEKCKDCKTVVELYEVRHSIKHNGKAKLVRHCVRCFGIVDFRLLTNVEISSIVKN